MESINNGYQESQEDLELKERYRSEADEEGFVLVSAFSHKELGKQTKSIAAFLDGDSGTNPEVDFGGDLKFLGNSDSYDRIKIHIDDLPTFIKRIKEWYGED